MSMSTGEELPAFGQPAAVSVAFKRDLVFDAAPIPCGRRPKTGRFRLGEDWTVL